MHLYGKGILKYLMVYSLRSHCNEPRPVFPNMLFIIVKVTWGRMNIICSYP
jgi:hypothetical protein